MNDENSLTLEKFQEMINLVCPRLYYAVDKYIEEGSIYICKETEFNPEYIIFHPNDSEFVRKTCSKIRTLVDLKEWKPDYKKMLRSFNYEDFDNWRIK